MIFQAALPMIFALGETCHRKRSLSRWHWRRKGSPRMVGCLQRAERSELATPTPPAAQNSRSDSLKMKSVFNHRTLSIRIKTQTLIFSTFTPNYLYKLLVSMYSTGKKRGELMSSKY